MDGLWVNFGRYLVPGKQWVEASQKMAKTGSEMLIFNICRLGFAGTFLGTKTGVGEGEPSKGNLKPGDRAGFDSGEWVGEPSKGNLKPGCALM